MVIYTPVTVTCLNMYTWVEERINQNERENLKSILGTMGNLAPFHSQQQNKRATRILEHNGARTTGEVHGNVTPPWY